MLPVVSITLPPGRQMTVNGRTIVFYNLNGAWGVGTIPSSSMPALTFTMPKGHQLVVNNGRVVITYGLDGSWQIQRNL
jgi:hypothetical protein